MAEPCLHCALRDTVDAYFDALGYHHGNDVIINPEMVERAIARLLADMLAAEPDNNARTQQLMHFNALVVDAVNRIREAGLELEIVHPS